ncbi:MAG: ribonuclease P protein component [Leptonema sp. (in: Bacteria)]|nr:ribonuclease P protein component [Leptonema sp. (in: bacteria)]
MIQRSRPKSSYKQSILTDRRDFAELFEKGQKIRYKNIQLISMASSHDEFKFAICVSTRFGKSTVRNRLKRIYRLAMMQSLNQVEKGWKVAILPAGKVEQLNSKVVSQQLSYLLNQHGFYSK